MHGNSDNVRTNSFSSWYPLLRAAARFATPTAQITDCLKTAAAPACTHRRICLEENIVMCQRVVAAKASKEEIRSSGSHRGDRRRSQSSFIHRGRHDATTSPHLEILDRCAPRGARIGPSGVVLLPVSADAPRQMTNAITELMVTEPNSMRRLSHCSPHLGRDALRVTVVVAFALGFLLAP